MSQQKQCEEIISRAMSLEEKEQIVLPFATRGERQSKKVMLYNAKKKLSFSCPAIADSISIKQGHSDGQLFITISKRIEYNLKPIIVSKTGKMETLDFSKGTIPLIQPGVDECQLSDRIKQLLLEQEEEC